MDADKNNRQVIINGLAEITGRSFSTFENQLKAIQIRLKYNLYVIRRAKSELKQIDNQIIRYREMNAHLIQLYNFFENSSVKAFFNNQDQVIIESDRLIKFLTPRSETNDVFHGKSPIYSRFIHYEPIETFRVSKPSKYYKSKMKNSYDFFSSLAQHRQDILSGKLFLAMKDTYKLIMQLRTVLTGQEMKYDIGGTSYVARLEERDFLEALSIVSDRNSLFSSNLSGFDNIGLAFLESTITKREFNDEISERIKIINKEREAAKQTVLSNYQILEILSTIWLNDNFDNLNKVIDDYLNTKSLSISRIKDASLTMTNISIASLPFWMGGDTAYFNGNNWTAIQDKAKGGIVQYNSIYSAANILYSILSNPKLNKEALVDFFTFDTQGSKITDNIYQAGIYKANEEARNYIKELVQLFST